MIKKAFLKKENKEVIVEAIDDEIFKDTVTGDLYLGRDLTSGKTEEQEEHNPSGIVFDGPFITLGTDINQKFCWSLRERDGKKYVALYKRDNGYSTFSDKDFITAISLDTIKNCEQLL